MLYKAIIQEIINDYSYKVRIPVWHKDSKAIGATPKQELPIATVATNAGIRPKLKLNDTVFVGFDENNTDKPVIVGLLYCKSFGTTVCDIAVDSIECSVNAKLPTETSIGNIDANTIKYLEGLQGNIQSQIDTLNNKINKIYENGCGANSKIIRALNDALSIE